MKVYFPHANPPKKTNVFVQPASDKEAGEHRRISDFFTINEKGEKVPTMFTVRFVDGVADVPSPLGKYMIDRGIARRSRIVLPQDMGADSLAIAR